jgi:hypothetical protein
MSLINAIPISTPHGIKSIEIYNDDITKLRWDYDILIVSAFHNSYNPAPGTLIESLEVNCNIVLREQVNNPELDLRKSLFCWLSNKLEKSNFKRILCLEGIKLAVQKNFSAKNALDNLFGFISLLAYKDVEVEKIVMPILGVGYQGNPMEAVLPSLLKGANEALRKNPSIKTICFVERDYDKALKIDAYINELLQRNKTQLNDFSDLETVNEWLESISLKLNRITELKEQFGKEELFHNLIEKLGSGKFKFYQFGILSRKLVEYLLCDLFNIENKLHPTIYDFTVRMREKGVSEWVVSCIHTIRTIGNASAHSIDIKIDSNKLSSKDMELMIMAVDRFLDYYIAKKIEIYNSPTQKGVYVKKSSDGEIKDVKLLKSELEKNEE